MRRLFFVAGDIGGRRRWVPMTIEPSVMTLTRTYVFSMVADAVRMRAPLSSADAQSGDRASKTKHNSIKMLMSFLDIASAP